MNNSTELEARIIDAIKKGRKLEAIKELRKIRNIDLKESKELVDSYCRDNGISGTTAKKENSGLGVFLLVILSVTCFFIYTLFI